MFTLLAATALSLALADTPPPEVEERVEAIASGEMRFWEAGLEEWRFGDTSQQALYAAFEAEVDARHAVFDALARAERSLPDDVEVVGCAPLALTRLSAARNFSSAGDEPGGYADARAHALPVIEAWQEAHGDLAAAASEDGESWIQFAEAVKDESDPVVRDLLMRAAQDQYGRTRFRASAAADLGPAGTTMLFAAAHHLVCSTDPGNTDWLRGHVREGRWFTIQEHGSTASRAAWLLAQHADHDPAFQQEVLDLIEPLARSGDIHRGNFAMLADRVAVHTGRPQTYGSQGHCTEDGWAPRTIHDPERVDERRAEMGLEPIEDYVARFAGSCG